MSNGADTERTAFSGRLQDALRANDYPGGSPTQLAREFNARYSGAPITVHAARKWIVCEAIPTQEKLRVLAAWLGVTEQWLRFGTGDGAADKAANPIESEHVKLISEVQRLGKRDQMLVREFVRTLVRLDRKGEVAA